MLCCADGTLFSTYQGCCRDERCLLILFAPTTLRPSAYHRRGVRRLLQYFYRQARRQLLHTDVAFPITSSLLLACIINQTTQTTNNNSTTWQLLRHKNRLLLIPPALQHMSHPGMVVTAYSSSPCSSSFLPPLGHPICKTIVTGHAKRLWRLNKAATPSNTW